MRRTGLVFHERYALARPRAPRPSVIPPAGFVEPGPHAESPERVRRIRSLVEVSGLGEQLAQPRPRPAERDELLRFHTPRVPRAGAASCRDGRARRRGLVLARRAEQLRDRGARRGRLPDRGRRGASAGDARQRLRARAAAGAPRARRHGHGRVHLREHGARGDARAGRARGRRASPIVDWDAHHGNGTQAAFWDDPSVLHDLAPPGRLLPARLGCGRRARRGRRAGLERQPPAAARLGRRRVRGRLRARRHARRSTRFRPGLVLVACGFDSCAWDPHARLMLHSDGLPAADRGRCSGSPTGTRAGGSS